MQISNDLLNVEYSGVLSTIKLLLCDKDPSSFLSAYDKLEDNQKFFTLTTILNSVPDVTNPLIKDTLKNLSDDLKAIKSWNSPSGNDSVFKNKVYSKTDDISDLFSKEV